MLLHRLLDAKQVLFVWGKRPQRQCQTNQNQGKRAHFEGCDKFCWVDLIGGSWRTWIRKPRNPETLNTASRRQECNTTKAVRLWEGKRFVILLLCSNLLNWLGIIRIWTWVNAAYPQTINSTFNCSRCQQHLKHVSSASNREGSSLCRQIAIELTTHCRIDSARTKLTIWSSSCSKLCKH